MSRVIPIKSNNGYDCCEACAYCDSEVCQSCEGGDMFEEVEPEEEMALAA